MHSTFLQKRIKFGLGVILLLAVGPAFSIEFSAQSVVTLPQKGEAVTKLYVGANAMRREANLGGQQQIEIIDLNQSKLIVLRPDSKQYMVMPLPPGASLPGKELNADPCKQQVPGSVSCRLIGEESVMGRISLKWSISGTVQGQQVSVTHWIDSEHKFPVRQEVDGKIVLEQRFIGLETLDGRSVERWEVVSTSPDGKAMKSVRWYDPELMMPYRQEMSNGFKQSLRDVEVGSQSPALFTVPSGYQQVEPK